MDKLGPSGTGGQTNKPEVHRFRRAVRAAIRQTLGYDVFISHAWSDGHEFARLLSAALSRRNLICFLDDEELNQGDQLSKRVARAVRSSALIVVLLTPAAFSRPWVELEVDLAQKRRKRVFPVRFQPPPAEAGAVLRQGYDDVLGLTKPADLAEDQWLEELADKIARERGRLTTRRQVIGVSVGAPLLLLGSIVGLVDHQERRRHIERWEQRGRQSEEAARYRWAELAHAQAAALGDEAAVARYRAAAAHRRLIPAARLLLSGEDQLCLQDGYAGTPIAVIFSRGRVRVHNGPRELVLNGDWSSRPSASFSDGRLLLYGDGRLVGIHLDTSDTWALELPGLSKIRLSGSRILAIRECEAENTLRVVSILFSSQAIAEQYVQCEGRVLASNLLDETGDLLVLEKSGDVLTVNRFLQNDGWRRQTLHSLLAANTYFGGEIGSSSDGRLYLTYHQQEGWQFESTRVRRQMVLTGPFPRVCSDEGNLWKKMLPLTGSSCWGAVLTEAGGLEVFPVVSPVQLDQPSRAVTSGVADIAAWPTSRSESVEWKDDTRLLAIDRSGGLWVYESGARTDHVICRLDCPEVPESPAYAVTVSRDGSVVMVKAGEAAAFWWKSSFARVHESPPRVPDLEREIRLRWTHSAASPTEDFDLVTQAGGRAAVSLEAVP